MRSDLLSASLLLILLTNFVAAGSWIFQDATLSIASKGAGVGDVKEKLTPGSPLSSAVSFNADDTLKILLTISENKNSKRPHQAFLLLQEPSTGLEDTYPLTVKESGKAKVDLTFKDLPVQFLQSKGPLKASLVLASFGSSSPLESHLFDLTVIRDESSPLQLPEKPLRYGKLSEIHHIFRSDPKSPPLIISVVFLGICLITLPILLGIWADMGVNLNQLPEAFRSAPVSHATFLASVAALEGIFFMYYYEWKLYQMLPAAGAAGLVAILSGSQALSEVQSRRLLGKRETLG